MYAHQISVSCVAQPCCSPLIESRGWIARFTSFALFGGLKNTEHVAGSSKNYLSKEFINIAHCFQKTANR